MGVHGLWKLIEPAGKPVPLESLENKVLAVDVSIWLYQLTKGLQGQGGAPVPNAHILGLFNRICKLLYYRIKPVFVFDGGAPPLKKETIEARKRQKLKAKDTSEQLREKLLNNLLKQQSINRILNGDENASSANSGGGPSLASKETDIFALPPVAHRSRHMDNESENEFSDEDVTLTELNDEENVGSNLQYGLDIHSIDINSRQFKSLPPEIRHEILSELMETRKQNSWGRIHEMPEQSEDFSKFQMQRLIKRRDVQKSMDDAAKEVGGRMMTLGELEEMFRDDGIVTESLVGKRIATDNVTRYIYVSNDTSQKSTNKKESNVLTRSSNRRENEKSNDDSVETIHSHKHSPVSNSVVKMDPQEEETRFRNRTHEIDSCIFLDIDDFRLDEEAERADEEGGHIFAKLLSNEENLSQDEILSIIQNQQNQIDMKVSPTKQQQCVFDSNKPCTSKSVYLERPEERSDELKTVVASKTQPKLLPKENNVEESKELKSNEMKITNQCVVRESNIVNESEEENDNDFIDVKPEESHTEISFETNRIIENDLFADTFSTDTEKPNFVVEVEGSSLKRKIPDTINSSLLPKAKIPRPDSGLSRRECDKSSDEYDDDDFIEVMPEVENEAKLIEICINPQVSKLTVEDDLFADVFGSTKGLEMTERVMEMEHREDKQTTFNGEITPEIVNKVEQIVPAKLTALTQKIDDTHLICSSPMGDDQLNNDKATSDTIKTPPSSNVVVTTSPSKCQSILNAGKLSLAEVFEKAKKVSNEVITTPQKQLISDEELLDIQKALQSEENELQIERSKQERLGSTITQQMIIEAQELLQLFGLPYVVAPMEAEAQCAFLDQISLTEGTITDDSDIWLFGGRKVYKNFFDNQKTVLQFRNVDIEHFFKLSRQQLIQMALLVGSDYTVGIEGIGPVTALEILAYFSSKTYDNGDNELANNITRISKTLKDFKMWINNNRKSITTSPLAKKMKNVTLSENFPSIHVIEAYLYPTVDESKDGFTWALPDLTSIRNYMQLKFGWKTNRIDDILLPVIKRLNEKKKQATLDSFFETKARVSSDAGFGIMSQRVKQAVNLMKNKAGVLSLQLEAKCSSTSLSPTCNRKSGRRGVDSPSKRTKKSPSTMAAKASSNRLKSSTNSEVIPQREQSRLKAAKQRQEAVKKIQATVAKKIVSRETRSRRKVMTRVAKRDSVKCINMQPRPDCSYLSESSSDG